MLQQPSRSCCWLFLLSAFLDRSGSFTLSPGPTDRCFGSQRRPETNDDHGRDPSSSSFGQRQSSWWVHPTRRIRRSWTSGFLREVGGGSSSRSGGGTGAKRRGSNSGPSSRTNRPEKGGAGAARKGYSTGRPLSSSSVPVGQRGRSRRHSGSSVTSSASASSAKSTASADRLDAASTPPPDSAPPKEDRRNPRSAPPWQVLSDKDAKRNVARELERRRLIKEGVKAAHEPIDDADGDLRAQLSSSLLSDRDRQFLKWRPNLLSRASSLALRAVGSYLGGNSRIPELGVPEVAFLGRSNVGKSSLLNRLVDGVVSDAPDSAVARVGKTPGATASVNLYAIHDAAAAKGGAGSRRDVLGLCDLPGFGYAKLSKEVQESVQLAAEQYLFKRRHLALGVLLVDIRRTPSDDDQAVLAALYDMGVPLLVVATKLDKLTSKRQRDDSLDTIRNGLGLPPNQPLAVSTVTGEGCRDLWKIILEACEGAVQEFGAKYDVGGDLNDSKVTGADRAGSSAEFEYEGDDEDDYIAYSQGYDWIHDDEGGVYYEGEDADDYEDDA